MKNLTTEEIEQIAQRAAEGRLMRAWEFLNEENDGSALAGVFCGCETCVIREILDAAWPALYELAHHPDTPKP